MIFSFFYLFLLGMSHEDGNITVNYDDPNRNISILKAHIQEAEETMQINTEAKNFVLKLEELARQKFH